MVARAKHVFDGEPSPDRALAGFVRIAVRRGFRSGAVAPVPLDRRAVEVFEVVGPAGEFGRQRRRARATCAIGGRAVSFSFGRLSCPCRRSPCPALVLRRQASAAASTRHATPAGETIAVLISSHSCSGIVRRGLRRGQDSSDNDQMTRDATTAPIACTVGAAWRRRHRRAHRAVVRRRRAAGRPRTRRGDSAASSRARSRAGSSRAVSYEIFLATSRRPVVESPPRGVRRRRALRPTFSGDLAQKVCRRPAACR